MQRPAPLYVVLLMAATTGFSGRASSQIATLDTAAIGSAVRQELLDTRTPGAVIGVVQGGRLIFAKAYGTSNIETGEPMRTEMLFRLGSTTKMMTASALLALVERGSMKLEEPIVTYVPGLHPSLGQLTAHRLLSNAAGMADIAPPFISDDDTALARMVHQWGREVTFAEPGKVNSYSSAGFWLAGYVVEAVSGMPYAQAMEELVFKPIGMKRSTLRPLMAFTYPISQPHRTAGEGPAEIVRPFFNNVAMWPAGSVFSNVDDLAAFMIAILGEGVIDGKRVMPASRVAQLEGKHIPIPGEKDSYYGYGTLTLKERGVEFVMHGGFSRGYGSMLQWSPKHRVGVIVLTNRSGETLSRSRGEILKRLVPFEPEQTPTPPKKLRPSRADVANFVGTYVNGPQTWEVLYRGDSLFVSENGDETNVEMTGPTTLSYGPNLEYSYAFVPDSQGRIEFLFNGLYAAKKKK